MPVDYAVIGIGGETCTLIFWMVVRGLLISLLWLEQGKWGLWHIAALVDDDGVYLNVIAFNLLFHRTISFDLDNSSITLEHPIAGDF